MNGDPSSAGSGGTIGGQGGSVGGAGGAGGETPAAPDVADPVDAAPIVEVAMPDLAPVVPPPPDLNRGRVGRWRFEDGMGNVAVDSSVVGNHGGTVAILNPDWKPGKIGMFALAFTAARRTFLQIADHETINPVDGLAISVWLNLGARTGAPRIAQKGETDEQYSLRIEEQQIVFVIKLANGVLGRVAAAAPPNNRWTHVVGSYDGRDLKLYLDAKEVASMPTSGPMSITNANLLVGGRALQSAPETEFLTGQLDELSIYDRGVSAAEAKLLHAAQ